MTSEILNLPSTCLLDKAETSSQLKTEKRPREQLPNEQSNNKRAKVCNEIDTYADHSLLHIFVEYAWEPSYGKCSLNSTMQLLRWLLKNVDVSKPESMDICKSKDQSISAKVSSSLRFFLPILQKCNGDVNYADECGQTVLHIFLKHCMRNPQPRLDFDLKLNKVVAALISKGASVNAADKFGSTPFSIAAVGLRRDLCCTMLRYFDNVNACDEKGDTVLHKIVGNRALASVWFGIVKALLKKGADPNRRNNDSLTPVHLAAKGGEKRILQVFAKNSADFSLRTPKDETSLLLYCRNDRTELLLETVEFLLTDDCDVTVPDEFGFSPIDYATRHGADQVVDRLRRFQAEKVCYSVDMSVTMLSASFTTDEDSFSELMDVGLEFSG